MVVEWSVDVEAAARSKRVESRVVNSRSYAQLPQRWSQGVAVSVKLMVSIRKGV